MKHNYHTEYGGLSISPLQHEEIELLRQLRNKHRECFFYSGEISAPEQEKWYSSYLEKKNDYVFSVYSRGKWIGSASLYNFSQDGTEAEFGRIVIEGAKGEGSTAVSAVCSIGFEQLGLSVISLEVFSDNIRAVRAYQKAGFIITDERESNKIKITAMRKNK